MTRHYKTTQYGEHKWDDSYMSKCEARPTPAGI